MFHKVMYMKSKFLLLTLFFSSLVYSEDFVYVCKDNDGFIINFKISTTKETIIHTTSLGTSGAHITNPLTRFEVFKEQKIAFWEYPKKVFTYERSEEDSNVPTTRYFNFETGTMKQISDGVGLKNRNLFNCVKS